jgi:hypothetical protein
MIPVSSCNQHADILTKPLAGPAFNWTARELAFWRNPSILQPTAWGEVDIYTLANANLNLKYDNLFLLYLCWLSQFQSI